MIKFLNLKDGTLQSVINTYKVYYSHQYYANGKLVSSIYFTAYDTQYMYKNGKFIGVWLKDTMFNSKAKKIMTRTNY